jgi:hypothetical protein
MGTENPRTATGTLQRQIDRTGQTFVVRAGKDGTKVWEAVEPSGEVEAKPRARTRKALGLGVVAVGVMAGLLGLPRFMLRRPPATVTPAEQTQPLLSTPQVEEKVQRPSPVQSVEIPPVITTRPASRRPDPGYVQIFVDPWAKVIIDGKSVGTTPVRNIALSPGRHHIKLSHPKRQTVEKSIRISSGKTELVDVELKPLVER